MNIVVFGGGKPNKFGFNFCNKARDDGHSVYVISHKSYDNTDVNHAVADFLDPTNVVDTFNKLLENVNNIDILLYATNGHAYPDNESAYKSTTTVDIQRWYRTMNLQTIIPHMICVNALKKMSTGSKFVFFTSHQGIYFSKKEWMNRLGYATGKAGQTHLMQALAYNNDKGAIATAILTHFPYEDPKRLTDTYEMIYNYIINFDSTENGSIKEIVL